MSPLHAYERSLKLLAQATPKLLEGIKAKDIDLANQYLDQTIDVAGHAEYPRSKSHQKSTMSKTSDAAEVEVEQEQKVQKVWRHSRRKLLSLMHPVAAQEPALAEKIEFDVLEAVTAGSMSL